MNTDDTVRTRRPWRGLTCGYILVPAYLYEEGKYKKQHNQLSRVFSVLLATALLCLISVFGVIQVICVFDVLNGYIQAIPNVFVSTIIKCLLVGMIFQSLKKKAQGDAKKEYGYAVLCAAIYGITNIIVDFIWSTVELVVLGSSWSAALAAEITSIPATIINAGFTVVGIAILYVPVKKAYKRILGA